MNFTVYKSSAGSGKTFTLVKEYLKLALSDTQVPPQKYRHILAITFTNKAAAEMKDRIIKALKELSEKNPLKISAGAKTLKNILQKELSLPEEVLGKRAERVLESILHNYSDFSIGTIDSFVHKVVRTFAFDLKIPVNFEIEMDSDKLLSQAIDILISQIGNNEKLTKALVEFAETKTDEEKSWHIEHDLHRFAAALLKEDDMIHIEKLKALSIDDFFQVRDSIANKIDHFETSIVNIATKASEALKKYGITNTDFYQGKNGIGSYFENLSKKRMDKINPNNYVKTTLGEDKWYAGKINESQKSNIDAVKSQLIDAFQELQTIVDEQYSDYVLFKLVSRNIYSLAVLHEIKKLLYEFKVKNNILHISEFNKIISKVVLHQPVPFIYERLGTKYHNYLIDEFQDTSILQWHNLLPLIDNSLSENHFTMLVGDGKQAIYRWRGGDVEQFSHLPQLLNHNDNPYLIEREENLKRNHKPQQLDSNFRSKMEIIQFNNYFFRTLSSKLNERYHSIYHNLEQQFNPENTGGYVSVEFSDKEKEDYYESTLARVHELILKLREDGYQFHDIAILCRKNTDGSEIANYLMNKGIGVISSDSLLLRNSSEVNFMIAVFKYLLLLDDSITKVEIIQYLIKNKYIQSEHLHEVITETAVTSSSPKFNSFLKNNFGFNGNQLIKKPLYELAEELIRIFNLNRNNNPYVQFFLDEILNYSIKYNDNPNNFIEWWKENKNKLSIVVPEGMNAVNIMTIHRSKGLEFPAVIVPFADWKITNGKDHLWIDLNSSKIPPLQSALVPMSTDLQNTEYAALYSEEKNKSLLDHLNVLYVAFTRPEKRLYVLTGKPGQNPSNLGTISDMLAYYYQYKREWNIDKYIYESGNTETRNSHYQKDVSAIFKLRSIHSYPWRNRIKIRSNASEIWDTEDTENKKNRGIVIHKVLSKINTYDDIESTLKNMLTEGLIHYNELTELSILLNKLLNVPQIKSFFEKGLMVKAEAEILLPDGKSYRPDRVILNKDTAIVIDYKTGKEMKTHKKQLQDYADVLKNMGFHSVEKYLIYLEEEKIEQVL